MRAEYLVLLTTTSSLAEAQKIGDHLVREQLAACVNIIPNISSIYKWKNQVCSDTEFLLLIKTSSSNFDSISDSIKRMHSYELPEIIAIPVIKGDPDYLKWVSDNSTQEGPTGQPQSS